MLKVTYLESGLYLECLQETMENWIALRVVLALQMDQRLVVERTTASLLLPIDLVKSSGLEQAARHQDNIMLSPGDADYLEVSLRGTWISSSADETAGVFATTLNPVVERLVLQVWQMSQVEPTSVWR